jgi:hypothetical protein
MPESVRDGIDIHSYKGEWDAIGYRVWLISFYYTSNLHLCEDLFVSRKTMMLNLGCVQYYL